MVELWEFKYIPIVPLARAMYETEIGNEQAEKYLRQIVDDGSSYRMTSTDGILRRLCYRKRG